MTIKELKEIKIIKLEIARIEYILKTQPNNTELQKEYIKILNKKKDDLLARKIEAEKFVKEIEDAEIRLILTLKFIDLKNWNYISRVLHYDRSTVYLKTKKFLEKSSNFHKKQHS